MSELSSSPREEVYLGAGEKWIPGIIFGCTDCAWYLWCDTVVQQYRPANKKRLTDTSREVNEARRGLILAAGRVRSKKKLYRKKKSGKNPAPPKTHHETHISPPTATTSRQTAKKRAPRVGPYSPTSKDAGLWKSASYSCRNQ